MSKPSQNTALLILATPVLVLGLAAGNANADTIYVCWDGSGDYLTIQAGIDAAVDGDEVVVCDGTYTGYGNKNLDFHGKAITVRSANGPDNCIIDCQNEFPSRGFHFQSGETRASLLQGLTITNAYTVDGAGIYCDHSSPTIADCTIVANLAYYFGGAGGGVACRDNSSPAITECRITENRAGYFGGGIYCEASSPDITDCTITGNRASEGAGILVIDGDATITNSTIAQNMADGSGTGIMCYWSSSATITNCTISGNTAPFGGAVHCEYDGSATVTNSIVWGNTPEQIYPPSDQLAVTYCDVQGGWPGEGNIETDPVFADPDGGDYHLKSVAGRWDPNANDGAGGWVVDDIHSFCVDAGDPASDYSNEPLPNGERINLGAYGNTIYASKSAPVATISGYTWDNNNVGIEGVWLSADNGGGSARTNDDGHYVLSVLSGWSGTVTPEKFLWSFEPPYRMYEDVAEDQFGQNYTGTRPTVFYVDDDAPGDPGPGDPDVSDPLEDGTPEHPFDAIREGIDVALDADMVLVADGVYTGNGNRDLDFDGKDIIVRSENGPHYSIIDCQGSEADWHGGFVFHSGETTEAVVDGLTITNAYSGDGSGIYCWQGSPTITNCVITGNTAEWSGGGVYCEYYNLSITNCTITGNTAGWYGGGVCYRDQAGGTITNCTISRNSADIAGGGVHCSTDVVTIVNSILSDNSPNQISGNVAVTYSDVQGGWTGQGNIDADPLFAGPDNGNYRLSPGSPCIDAADNEVVPADELDLDGDGDTDEPMPFDLDGNPRFIDDLDTEDTGNPDPDYPELPIVDMGAYEFQIPGDLNGDGCVDQADLGILLGDWGCTGGDCPGDCDHDGDTDQADLGILLAHWGQGCP